MSGWYFAHPEAQYFVVGRLGRDQVADYAGPLGWMTNTGAFKEESLEGDAVTVRSVYLEEGYVDVKVDPAKVYLTPDKRSIVVSIHVEEGPQYKLGALRFQGDFVPEEGLTEAAAREVLKGETAKTVGARWHSGCVPAPCQ